jgi:hypothetical protein
MHRDFLSPGANVIKLLFTANSTVKPSFSVTKQNYHGEYLAMEVNTQLL